MILQLLVLGLSLTAVGSDVNSKSEISKWATVVLVNPSTKDGKEVFRPSLTSFDRQGDANQAPFDLKDIKVSERVEFRFLNKEGKILHTEYSPKCEAGEGIFETEKPAPRSKFAKCNLRATFRIELPRDLEVVKIRVLMDGKLLVERDLIDAQWAYIQARGYSQVSGKGVHAHLKKKRYSEAVQVVDEMIADLVSRNSAPGFVPSLESFRQRLEHLRKAK